MSLLYGFAWTGNNLVHPVPLPGKRIGWQTDPMRQGRGRRGTTLSLSSSCRSRVLCRSIQEHPIHIHSSHPYLCYLWEILLLAPDAQQGLSICISFKERCIIG